MTIGRQHSGFISSFVVAHGQKLVVNRALYGLLSSLGNQYNVGSLA